MFLKLVLTIVWCLAVGAAMLSMRHARLEAVHDLANTQRRVLQADRELWRLRAGVAELAEPGRVRRLAEGLGPLVHVIESPVVVPRRVEDGFAGVGPGEFEGGGDAGVDVGVGGGVLVITADESFWVFRDEAGVDVESEDVLGVLR